MTARNWSSPASSGTGAEPRGSGPRRRGAACDCEEARLLAGLPDVLLPVRSVKC